MYTGKGKSLGRLQGGIEAFVFKRALIFWLVKAAFQVGKHHVGRVQSFSHARKRNGRVVHPEQIDITG
jgi:hypothetical protein